MADARSQSLEVSPERSAAMFPALSPAHLARIESHGSLRRVDNGEVLVQAGEPMPAHSSSASTGASQPVSK